MSYLVDLPNELLEDIILRVRDTSKPDALVNLSLSCKALYRLVRPIQNQHVLLLWRLNKTAPIARYMAAHGGDTDLRIIRLQPQKGLLNAFRVGMVLAEHHVQPMCEFLASLPHLTTFSLNLDRQVDSRSHLRGSVLARIVHSLPSSVIHLEIDTEAVDRIAAEQETVRLDDQHLCVAISNCIPRLHTLWLRVSCICSDLFRSLQAAPGGAQPTSALRRAFIRLDNSPGKESRLSVSQFVGNCAVPKHDRDSVSAGTAPHHRKLNVFRTLLGFQAAGAFPHLERFMVYSWTHLRTAIDNDRQYLKVKDVASRTATRYPRYWANEMMDWPIKEIMDKERETFNMIRSHEGEDYYDDHIGLEAAMLHDVIWTETPSGIRYPPQDALPHAEPRLHTLNLLDAEYLHKQQDEKEGEYGTRKRNYDEAMKEEKRAAEERGEVQYEEAYTLPKWKKVRDPITNDVIVKRY